MQDNKLIVVPTPIGNLGDMTLRAKEVLLAADLIACEDTRTTGRLLQHLGASAPTISYHMHNEKARTQDILDAVSFGKTVALVSDAGMPGISDPGQVVIAAAIEAGIEVDVLPGPSAFVTVLVGSGLATDRFSFIGFLEKNRSKRKRQLEALIDRQETLIFYEAPHRMREFLPMLESVLGNRKACLGREVTKLHQEYERGTLSELGDRYLEKTPRGEYVIVVEGKSSAVIQEEMEAKLAEISIEDQVFQYIEAGLSKMEAVKKTAKERGLKKNDVYMKVIDIE